MVKVITYGTYDLLHYGHVRLLERAKALGDYLIVGVTSDTFDRERGKINVQQSLMERVEAVRATGLADEIIIEEYEGQKIDDIKRLNVDIFTVGSDWKGKFDYLKAYCQVVYLDRTSGVSSTEIRSEQQVVRLGLVGESPILNKIERESQYVNGLESGKVFTLNDTYLSDSLKRHPSRLHPIRTCSTTAMRSMSFRLPRSIMHRSRRRCRRGSTCSVSRQSPWRLSSGKNCDRWQKTGSWCSWIPSRRLILWLTIVFYYWQREAS